MIKKSEKSKLFEQCQSLFMEFKKEQGIVAVYFYIRKFYLNFAIIYLFDYFNLNLLCIMVSSLFLTITLQIKSPETLKYNNIRNKLTELLIFITEISILILK